MMFIFGVITLNGCSNETTSVEPVQKDMYNKAYFKTASLKEKNEYRKYHLLKIASYLAKNYQKADLTNAIMSKSEDKLEYQNVYVKDLINSVASKNSVVETSPEYINFQNSLNAFSGIFEKNWLPVISIPEASLKNQMRGSIDDSKPVYIVSQEVSSENGSYDGYQLTENGIFDKLDAQIDEQAAENRMVLVLHTRLDQGGYSDEGPISSGGGGDGNIPSPGPIAVPGSSTPTNPGPGLRIRDMIIKQHKEDWAFGDSEINIVAFIENENPAFSGVCGNPISCSVNCYNYDGKEIKCYSRCQVDDQSNIFLYYLLNLNNSGNGTTICFIIFESDPEAEIFGNQTHTFTFPNGNTRNLTYNSNQGFYNASMVTLNPYSNAFPQANGYTVNNDAISFNLEKYY